MKSQGRVSILYIRGLISYLILLKYNSKIDFPFFFGINFIILVLMIKVNVTLLKKYSPISLVKMAIFIQTFSGFIFILLYKLNPQWKFKL